MSYSFSKKELNRNPKDYSSKTPSHVLAIFIQKCNDRYENGKSNCDRLFTIKCFKSSKKKILSIHSLKR